VKVVFHQTAVSVTPLSTWIIYPKRSALGYSTRSLADRGRGYLKWILSFRLDAEPADPLTKKGAGAAATWTPSFCCQRFPGPSRNSFWVWERAGKARRLLSYLIGRQNEERARQSYHRFRKSLFPSDKTHRRPSSRFWWKRNPISISESVFLPLPSSSLSFHGWGKHFLIWTWRAFFTSLIQRKRGVNIGRLKDDFQVLATPCVQYKIWKAAGMTKGGFLSCTEKLRGIIDRYVCISYSWIPYFFWYHRYISISQIEKERADGSYPLYRRLNPIYWSKDLRQIPDFAFSFF